MYLISTIVPWILLLLFSWVFKRSSLYRSHRCCSIIVHYISIAKSGKVSSISSDIICRLRPIIILNLWPRRRWNIIHRWLVQFVVLFLIILRNRRLILLFFTTFFDKLFLILLHGRSSVKLLGEVTQFGWVVISHDLQ